MDERLLRANEGLAIPGFTLTTNDLTLLDDERADALADTGRVEFAEGPLEALSTALANSAFLDQDNLAMQLADLQRAFYQLKEDTVDEFGDEACATLLADAFEEAQGDVNLAFELALEELRREPAGGGHLQRATSTSVCAWDAYDRLCSLTYVVGQQEGDEQLARLEGMSAEQLLEAFGEGLAAIERTTKAAHELWQRTVVAAPLFASRSMRDTLASIGRSFECYEPSLLAHEMPCDIDYQLVHPVDEHLLGVDYVYEYLRRLWVENDLLGRFDAVSCQRVLDEELPEWPELVANLLAPVAERAVCLALCGEDPRALMRSDDMRWDASRVVLALPIAARRHALATATDLVAAVMGACDESCRAYLEGLSTDMLPRLVAMGSGRLSYARGTRATRHSA